MKQLFILIIICLPFFQTLDAQPQLRAGSQDLYLFCSSVTDAKEGILRVENPDNDNDPLYEHRPIHFIMLSKAKNIYACFDHYNYNPTKLSKIRTVEPAKDQMEIMITSRGMLKFIYELKPITLEDKLASFRTKEEVWTWMDSLKTTGKRIYILDWNDSFNQNGNGQIKLIQVMPGATNRPLY